MNGERLLSVPRRAVPRLHALADRPEVVLPALVGLSSLLLLVFALTVRHNGWIFYQGGDQIWYTTTGWQLAHGELPPTRVGYGWSLLLAPIMLFFGPGYVDAMPAVIALNVLVLGPSALVAVHSIASRIAGRTFALWTAALWVVLPYAAIPLWRADYHERYVEQFLPQALGLSGLADYPSMVALLCAAALTVRALQEESDRAALLAGLAAGFAVGTKPSNALFLAAPALALLVARRLRPLAAFGIALLPSLITLAIWKQRGLGALPLFAFEETRTAAGASIAAIGLDRYIDVDWATLRQNLNELREWFWSARLLEWAPLAGAIAVARRSPAIATLLALWLAAFVVVKGTSPLATVASGSFFRLLMPAWPAYLLLAASLPLLVPGVTRALAPPRRATTDVPGVALYAALALLAAAPLLISLAARPATTPSSAILVNGILTPVDDSFNVEIRPDGAAREVTWETPAGRAASFYRVFRSAAGGEDTSCDGSSDRPGAAECRLELLLLGTTREGRWRDGSPPAGSVYRIGRAANWRDDPTGGDVYLISPPLRDSRAS